jgi:hypothetical protein
VVVGDSFGEYALLPQDALVSSQLGRQLNLEVANLSQSDYGPQQELAVVRRYALPLRPEVVVWLFYEGNDFRDVQRYEALTHDWDATLRAANRYEERSIVHNLLSAVWDFDRRWSRQSSFVARRSSCHYSRATAEEDQTLYFGNNGILSNQDKEAASIAQNSVLDAQRMLHGSGGELLFVFVPITFRVYQPFCEFPADGFAKDWPLSELLSVLESWARTNGVPYFDLTAPLRDAAASGTLAHFPDDSHWNATGTEIAASAIAKVLVEGGFLSRPRPLAEERVGENRRRDVVSDSAHRSGG